MSVTRSYDCIRLESEPPITWLVLNREERLNALSAQLLAEFSDALRVLAEDDETRVIVIRGAGRAFSAGYDWAPEGTSVQDHEIVADHDRLVGNINRFLDIWEHPKPVIAAVHGYCLAGATQLCVCCDITVVAEDAIIGLPALPAGGGYITPMWVPLVGPKRAKQMAFVPGSRITGAVAAEWGWANYAVPADELESNVRQLALKIAKVPPAILHMKKVSINRVADVMGFRTVATMGAETDALLHQSAAAQQLRESIRSLGLKEAIRRFEAGQPPENGH